MEIAVLWRSCNLIQVTIKFEIILCALILEDTRTYPNSIMRPVSQEIKTPQS